MDKRTNCALWIDDNKQNEQTEDHEQTQVNETNGDDGDYTSKFYHTAKKLNKVYDEQRVNFK